MAVLNLPSGSFVAVIAGIYAILSLGLYVQFSIAGLPNFGHVAFMAVAAYTMAILVVRYACADVAGRGRRRRSRRSSSPCCSAFRRCACAPTISPSRPSPAARSSATWR